MSLDSVVKQYTLVPTDVNVYGWGLIKTLQPSNISLDWPMADSIKQIAPSLLNRRLLYNYIITSRPGAPVAPRNAASRHADRLYGQVRNRKYSNIQPT